MEAGKFDQKIQSPSLIIILTSLDQGCLVFGQSRIDLGAVFQVVKPEPIGDFSAGVLAVDVGLVDDIALLPRT